MTPLPPRLTSTPPSEEEASQKPEFPPECRL